MTRQMSQHPNCIKILRVHWYRVGIFPKLTGSFGKWERCQCNNSVPLKNVAKMSIMQMIIWSKSLGVYCYRVIIFSQIFYLGKWERYQCNIKVLPNIWAKVSIVHSQIDSQPLNSMAHLSFCWLTFSLKVKAYISVVLVPFTIWVSIWETYKHKSNSLVVTLMIDICWVVMAPFQCQTFKGLSAMTILIMVLLSCSNPVLS